MIYNDMKRYVGAVTGTVIVTITGKNATYTYDGSSHSATSYTVSISNSDYKTSDFTFSGSASVSRTAAGTSYMGLSASQFTNTNAKFKDVRFVVTDGYITINKKAVTVTIKGNNASYTYSGGSRSLSGYTATSDSSLYTTSDYTVGGTSSVSGTNAGTYKQALTATNNNSNFNVTFNITQGVLTINKLAVTVSIAGSGTSTYTYDGAAHTIQSYTFSSSSSLYTASLCTISKVSRTVVGTTANAITAVNNSGNFTVTFNITNDTLTINKAASSALGLSVTSYSGGYDGAAHSVTVSVAVTSGTTIQYSTDNTNWSTTKPTATAIGTTTVYVRAVNSNYNTATGSATITISKGSASSLGLSVSGYTGEYDGNAHSITVSVRVTSGTTIQYSTDNTNWSTTKPTRTNAGTTTVFVRAVNSNYDTATASATITIAGKFFLFKRGTGLTPGSTLITGVTVTNDGIIMDGTNVNGGRVEFGNPLTVGEWSYTKMVMEYEYMRPSSSTGIARLAVSSSLLVGSPTSRQSGGIDTSVNLDPTGGTVSRTFNAPVVYLSGYSTADTLSSTTLLLRKTTDGMWIIIRNWWLE